MTPEENNRAENAFNTPVNNPENQTSDPSQTGQTETGQTGTGQYGSSQAGAPNPEQTAGSIPVDNAGSSGSAAQRTTQAARAQAGVAADAFRRGEFMQDAAVDGSANSDDRLIALLSYITQVFIPVVMPVIVLLSESSKKRPFQRYHAVQSLALTLLFILVAFAAGLGATIIQIIPLVGQVVAVLLFCLSPIAYLMAVIAMFYYGYQAYQGKRFAIPGLTTFLRDQGWMS